MKRNSTKTLKWLAGTVIIFGALYVLMVGSQTYGFFTGNTIQQAVWADGVKFLQGSIAIFRFIGAAAFFALILAFIINSIKAMTDGILFPGNNTKLLLWSAAASFVFLFCNSNINNMHQGIKTIQFTFMEIIVPVMICIFAVIYKVAVRVCEENRLTV